MIRKNELRTAMRQKRKQCALSFEDTQKLITNFNQIPIIQPSNNLIIASYEKMGSEIDPSCLMTDQNTFVYPEVLDNETMRFAQTPDIIILPLIAFDRQGNRLGQGGGYYDRYLTTSKALHIGLAYAEQEVPQLPTEPHDQKLHWIITPKEAIKCQ